MHSVSLLLRTAVTVLLLAPPLAGTPAAAAEDLDLCPGITHSGPSFVGQDLRNENFANQDLAGADFTGAKLEGTTFEGADLAGADFRGATLGYSATFNRSTTFQRADLTETCFASLPLPTVRFEFADLECTVFAAADVRTAELGPVVDIAAPGGACRTSFAGARMGCGFIAQWKDLDLRAADVQACADELAGVDFSGGWLDGVSFAGLDLEGTRWVQASLRQASFVGAVLHDAVFSAADLRDAQLSGADAQGAWFDQQVRLSGANLSGVDLEGAHLAGADLEAADNRHAAILSLAYLANADLTGAQLTGVNLSHASFYGELASATNADMSQTDFVNANLGSANLTGGTLLGARLDAANLINAKLRGADLRPVAGVVSSSLVQASLQGTDLTEAHLQGANLANAAVALEPGVPLWPLDRALAADLDRQWLSAEVVDGFEQHGIALVPCSNPTVLVETAGRSWRIVSLRPVGGYRILALAAGSSGAIAVRGVPISGTPVDLFSVTDPGGTYAADLDDRLLASGLLQDFADQGFELPPCANPAITVTEPTAAWELIETLGSANVASRGYTGFRLLDEAAESGGIEVYGSMITIVRPDGKGSLGVEAVAVHPTMLDASSFDDTTTCPNQRSYGANRDAGLSWKQMMTAVVPPRPPLCIPNPYVFCPAP